MDSQDKNVKIPLFIVDQMINIIEDVKDLNENEQINNLYLYLIGKKFQVELRNKFNKDTKIKIKYNENKKLLEELRNKLLVYR